MVVVTEKGKIAAYEIVIMEKHTDLDGKYPQHRKKCPCCDTIIEEKPYDFVESMNAYYFDVSASRRTYDEPPIQIMANNFENAKKALGCDTKNQIHDEICNMLKEKDEGLRVVEEKHTRKEIPKSRW